MHGTRTAALLFAVLLLCAGTAASAQRLRPPSRSSASNAVLLSADYLGVMMGTPRGRAVSHMLHLVEARPQEIADQLVVRRKPGVAAAKVATLHASVGARVIQRIPQLGIEVVKLPSAGAARAYRTNPSVLWASTRKLRYPLIADPNDPAYSDLDTNISSDPDVATWYKWDLHMVDAAAGWSIWPGRYYDASGKGADAVTIAVLDTGIDYDHPDFINVGGTASDVAHGGQLLRDLDASISNGVVTPEAWDVYGHGTHVAGIAAAATNNSTGTLGLGYNANVLSIRVIDSAGNGTDTDIAQGIVYAADHGALICNLSLGSYQYSQAEQDAVNYAWRKGALVIAAVGNDGNNYQFNYPASMSRVLAVSACSRLTLASYSNYGDPVGITAPGGDFDYDIMWLLGVYSTMPTYYVPLNDPNVYGAAMYYDYLMGTSMAAPEVAGLAALYAGRNGITQSTPNAPLRIWQAIQQGADGAGGWDPYFGYGLISPYGTLNLGSNPNPRGDTVGSVTGQVRYKGTVVQNATVVARPTSSVQSWTASTRADGGYRLPNMPAGSYKVTATYFGESLKVEPVAVSAGCDMPGIDFNIGAVNTTLSASSVVGAPGETVTLSAVLRRADTAAGLEDCVLDFEVDGHTLGPALTDASGSASIQYTIPADATIGDHTIGVYYTGQGAFNDSSASATLTVAADRTPTFMWLGSTTVGLGQQTHVWSWIWRTSDWKDLPSVPITFSIDGSAVSTIVANSGGGALLEYTIPTSMAVGSHALKAEFAGNASYLGSSATATLTVTSSTGTWIWVQPATAGAGQDVTLAARLVTTGGSTSVPGMALTFRVNGVAAGSGTTGTDGFARVTLAAPVAAGTYPVVVEFAGDGSYASSAGSGTLTVSGLGQTFLWVGGGTVARGAVFHTWAWLWRTSDWRNVPGKTVVFLLDGSAIATVVGNVDGGSVLDYTIPQGLSTGAHTLTARFDGDAAYSGCQATSTITVTP